MMSSSTITDICKPSPQSREVKTKQENRKREKKKKTRREGEKEKRTDLEVHIPGQVPGVFMF